MPATACPSRHDLELALLGQLPDQQLSAFEEHFLACPTCIAAAGTIGAGDPLVQSLARQPVVDAELSRQGEQLDSLITRMREVVFGALYPTLAKSDFSEATPPPAREPAADEATYTFLSPPQTADELGRLGGYRVLRVLGAGGMGVVFEAEDPRLKRRVAIKVMRPEAAAIASARQRFVREAQTLAAIEHDHVVAIYQVGEESGTPFIAMPFLHGETLDQRLRREGKLPVDEAVRIGRELADGLAAAHARGLIHRDVKPANVWLESGRARPRAKLLDFGLAHDDAADVQLTQSAAIMGTPAYMSPEQARGIAVDARADLFSLGCVLYRMIVGEPPFKGKDPLAMMVSLATETPHAPHELVPEVPVALSELIMRMLAKDADGRPRSALEVMEGLGWG